jgi:hypothetical protein
MTSVDKTESVKYTQVADIRLFAREELKRSKAKVGTGRGNVG